MVRGYAFWFCGHLGMLSLLWTAIADCGEEVVARSSGPERLNIVFILADDLGYAELGCFGQSRIETPHLDELARNGVRLTQHYAGAPTCAASRCVLLTGRSLARAEIRGNRDSGNGRAFPGQWPLSEAAVTIPGLLQAAGYSTAGFGKWGLGPTDSVGSPLRHGFDRYFGYNCQRNAHSYYPPFLDDDAGVRSLNNPSVPGHQQQLEGEIDDADYRGKVYAPDLILAEALSFLERQPRDRPFFLYLPLIEPHVALHPPQGWIDRYPREWDRELGAYRGENGYLPHSRPRAAYAAMISHLDDHVGRVVAALKQRGLYEQTLIVFTSDNGPAHEGRDPRFSVGGAAVRFFESTAGLRGSKGSCYEGGLRVPCIVRWPGVTNSGAVSDCLSYFPDWMPTLCRAAGLQPPAGSSHDGVDLSAALAGAGEVRRSAPLLWDFTEYGGIIAAREGKWKAIRRGLNQPLPLAWELYDLDADRAEAFDLAATHPEIVQRLEQAFINLRTVEPDFPNRLYDPLTKSGPTKR